MTDSATPNESPAFAPKIKRKPSRLRWVAIAGAAIGLYALAGFVAIPALIKSKLPQFATEQLKRKASIGASALL